jgi:hypothetical protein
MPQVLTTNALITCPHGGLGKSIPTDPKWSVNGGIVLLENDTGTLACPFVIYPCIGYQLVSMKLNATQVDGRQVILTTDFQKSLTGLPLSIVDFHQTIDDSTPAPIPGGEQAPPLSPALADAIKPVVTAAPPALAFSSITMQPASLAVNFILISDYPMMWILTLINEPALYHMDLTNGLPPGVTVVPAGGGWDTPSLTVSMTLTAAFMAALGIGKHHFYMTGVNQRGLPGFKEVILTVS